MRNWPLSRPRGLEAKSSNSMLRLWKKVRFPMEPTVVFFKGAAQNPVAEL